MESRARRAAIRVGWTAVKSRWRRDTHDNYGGFRIVDPDTDSVVYGEKFDLTPEDVIGLCREQEGEP
jgi:hypothetical protein